jgi:hypothetical protein
VAAEGYVHTLLESRGLRLNVSREFFQTDATTAIKAVMAAPGQRSPADAESLAGDDDVHCEDHPAALIYEEAQRYYYGTVDTVKNRDKALRLFQQAASLGLPDAWIAIGDMYLYGVIGRENPRAAAECFHKAIDGGNYFGYACLAHALETIDPEESDKAWDIFFRKYTENPRYATMGLPPTSYLKSFVFRMVTRNRTDVKIPAGFASERERVARLLRIDAEESKNPELYTAALAWLDANP